MSVAAAICSKIAERLGLAPHPRFVPSLERAEPRLVERYGVSLAELAERMDHDREVFHDLAGALSVGETFFLRHDAHFDRIVALVSKRLGEFLDGNRVVIWSAGCSSGEEPYSVALALVERLGEAVLERISVVATDVDPRAIARAERAEYSPWSFRGAPSWLDERYFRRTTGELRELTHARIKAAVSFDCATLEARAASFATGSIDVVLFRNVSIYLRDDAREALHVEMRRILRPTGLLVQGPSDPAPLTTEFVREPSDATFCCHLPVSELHPARPLTIRLDVDAIRAPTPGREELRAREPRARPAPALDKERRARTRPASPAMTAPTKAASRAHLEEILVHAERGRLDEALEALEAFALEPARRSIWLGKLHLAANDPEAATDHLRRAVFLASEDVVARYWYAHALHLSREAAAAHKQLVELERRLARLHPSESFYDGEVSVKDLASSVSFLLGGYR